VKFDQKRVDRLSNALAEICPPERLRLIAVDTFGGPTPRSPRPAIGFTVEIGGPVPAAADFRRHLRRHLGSPLPAEIADLPEHRDGTAIVASEVAKLAAELLEASQLIEFGFGAATLGDGFESGWVDQIAPEPTFHAIATAIVAAGAVLADQLVPVEGVRMRRALFDQAGVRDQPTFESAVLINAARARDIPFLPIGANPNLWQFGWGTRSEHFWVTSNNADGMVANRISSEKEMAKRLMRSLGLPTPRSIVVGPKQDHRPAAAEIGWPCVVKPLNGGSGKGVSADIRDLATLDRAVAEARKFRNFILVEAHVPGDDYRLMVVDGKLVAAVRRDLPVLVGDGRRSVAELLAAQNRERQGTARERRYLVPVLDDDVMNATLENQGVTRSTILPAGKQILLRTNANRSTGATCVDVLDKVHPQIKAMAEQVTAAFGFRTSGIDYITTDITRSHEEVGGGFLELNSTAGLYVLMAAGLTEDEIGGLVLGKQPGRIPVSFLLVPAEARGEAAGLLRERLSADHAAAGEDWGQVGPLTLPADGLDAAALAEALLRFKTANRATIVWTFDELQKFGLPVDAVDTAVVLGPPPPADWLALLDRHSNRRILANDLPDAIENCLVSVKIRTGTARRKSDARI
jgi:D-alanine-D-alanine ligase-like ATP-grasp enzyme